MAKKSATPANCEVRTVETEQGVVPSFWLPQKDGSYMLLLPELDSQNRVFKEKDRWVLEFRQGSTVLARSVYPSADSAMQKGSVNYANYVALRRKLSV